MCIRDRDSRALAEAAGVDVGGGELIDDARLRAEEIISTAERDAERIRTSEDATAQGVIAELEAERERLAEDVARLTVTLKAVEASNLEADAGAAQAVEDLLDDALSLIHI